MNRDDSGKKSRAQRTPLPPDMNPPIEVIRAKERDIAERIAAAQAKAEEMLAEARRQAAAAIRAAEEGGARADGARQTDVAARAQTQATEIRRRAQGEADAIETVAGDRQEEAVRIVLDAVVPATPAKERTRQEA